MAIQTATFGRSEGGLKTLKSNLQSQCSSMKNKLRGKEYKELISVINANWAGADATDWKNDLSAKISEVEKALRSLSTKSQGLLDSDLASFKSFQAKNVK